MEIRKALGISRMFIISWRGIYAKERKGIEIYIPVYNDPKALIRIKILNFGSLKPMFYQMLTTRVSSALILKNTLSSH